MQTWSLGQPVAEESLFDARVAEAFRSVDGVAPKDAQDVFRLQGRQRYGLCVA